MEKAEILGRKVVARGKYVQLEQVEFRNEKGKRGVWDAAERVNTRGAVMIIGHLMPSNRVLLVRQFRPPTGKYVVEFPAGLIDGGERAEETAHRELKEETGYTGLLTFCSEPVYSTSGMTGESLNVAIVEINDFEFAEKPTPHPEESECIEIFAVEMGKLREFIGQKTAEGDGVDSKVLVFMMAQEYFHG